MSRAAISTELGGRLYDTSMPTPHLYTTLPTTTERAALEKTYGGKIEPWMWNVLNLNPDYTGWGVERGSTGYLREKHDPDGHFTMDSSRVYRTWSEFIDSCMFGDFIGNFEPDEFNEIVHFYFGLEQATETSPLQCFLMLWVLHPRCGASVAIKIEQVDACDLDAILSCLGAAAVRNIARFGPLLRLVAIPVSTAPGVRTSRTTLPNLNVERPS